LPQAPQFLLSDTRSTQVVPHFVCPGEHSLPPPVQVPLTHVVPLVQTVPHEPQLLLSVARFTHVLPHRVWPDGHSFPPPPLRQRPFTQVLPEPQTRLHEPQLFGSVFRSTQTPRQYDCPEPQQT
jgi:hypothetical protein